MAINAQNIVILGSNPNSVREKITEFVKSLGFDPVETDPVKQITAPREFEKRKRRLFFLQKFPKVICLSELGDLADQTLAKELSRSLSISTFWIALHESENAWGMIHFLNGEVVSEELHPRSAFDSDADEQPYDGDATEEAFKSCEGIGDFEPFVTYYQLSQAYKNTAEVIIHVAFKKPWSA